MSHGSKITPLSSGLDAPNTIRSAARPLRQDLVKLESAGLRILHQSRARIAANVGIEVVEFLASHGVAIAFLEGAARADSLEPYSSGFLSARPFRRRLEIFDAETWRELDKFPEVSVELLSGFLYFVLPWLDYPDIVALLRGKGMAGLNPLLAPAEQVELFETVDPGRIIELVLRGLGRL
ncbi:MAG TPA: hypothetical protein VJU77_13855 [Chthoniobacterales bacterium]|nr:hypothetical protein [Chthoniobacterales bacterium]